MITFPIHPGLYTFPGCRCGRCKSPAFNAFAKPPIPPQTTMTTAIVQICTTCSLQLKPPHHRLPRRLRPERSAEVVSRFAGVDCGDHGAFDDFGFCRVAEVLEHHRCREDGADRVGHILPRVLRCGAVDWLEHRYAAGMDVA